MMVHWFSAIKTIDIHVAHMYKSLFQLTNCDSRECCRWYSQNRVKNLTFFPRFFQITPPKHALINVSLRKFTSEMMFNIPQAIVNFGRWRLCFEYSHLYRLIIQNKWVYNTYVSIWRYATAKFSSYTTSHSGLRYSFDPKNKLVKLLSQYLKQNTGHTVSLRLTEYRPNVTAAGSTWNLTVFYYYGHFSKIKTDIKFCLK